nr:hypothetical protein GCM10020185_01790 [Pseudomonas brassicacearum subsp. brassicacearum]
MSDQQIVDLIDPDDFIFAGRRAPAPGAVPQGNPPGRPRWVFFSFDSVADTFTHCFAAPVKDPNGVAIATLCIVAPRADAKNNYADYRRVLIESANHLARRINE